MGKTKLKNKGSSISEVELYLKIAKLISVIGDKYQSCLTLANIKARCQITKLCKVRGD